MKTRIGITLNEAQLEIWPIDDWSRKRCVSILARHSIGFTYVATTMGTTAFQFYNESDYKLALEMFLQNVGDL